MESSVITKSAIQTFGIVNQLEMTIEELSELIQSINKIKRNFNIDDLDKIKNGTEFKNIKEALVYNNMCSEIADVSIMLEQIGHVVKFNNNKEFISDKIGVGRKLNISIGVSASLIDEISKILELSNDEQLYGRKKTIRIKHDCIEFNSDLADLKDFVLKLELATLMVEQLSAIFKIGNINLSRERKLERLEGLIEKYNNI